MKNSWLGIGVLIVLAAFVANSAGLFSISTPAGACAGKYSQIVYDFAATACATANGSGTYSLSITPPGGSASSVATGSITCPSSATAQRTYGFTPAFSGVWSAVASVNVNGKSTAQSSTFLIQSCGVPTPTPNAVTAGMATVEQRIYFESTNPSIASLSPASGPSPTPCVPGTTNNCVPTAAPTPAPLPAASLEVKVPSSAVYFADANGALSNSTTTAAAYYGTCPYLLAKLNWGGTAPTFACPPGIFYPQTNLAEWWQNDAIVLVAIIALLIAGAAAIKMRR